MSIVFSKLIRENNIPLQNKTVSPSESLQEVTPDQQYYGLSKVTINPISLQNLGISITENGTTRVTVDDRYDGIGSISIDTNVAGSEDSSRYLNIIRGMMGSSNYENGEITNKYEFAITPNLLDGHRNRVEINLTGSNVTSIDLPEYVTNGKIDATGCQLLKYIEVPNGKMSITGRNSHNLKYVNADTLYFTGDFSYHFNESSLNHIKMPNTYSIASSAFYYCTHLKVVDFRGKTDSNIPSVSSTDDFFGVPSNCKVVIPDSLYSAWTNWGAENRSPWYSLSQSLTYVKESEYETDGLVYREESGYIGDNGEYVWDYVFTGIGNSEDMDITIKNRIGGGNPSSYRTIIANNAFENNENLLHITMPSNLYQINSGSFSNCTNLKSIDFSSASRIPIVDSYSFHNVPKTCKFIIPSNLYDSWITSPVWDTLYNEGYNFVRK